MPRIDNFGQIFTSKAHLGLPYNVSKWFVTRGLSLQ